MKLLTLKEAKSYNLDDTNHISCKETFEVDVPYVHASYNIITWDTNTKNEQGEELIILLDDEGYWQPYIEFLFKLQNIPVGKKYEFGYIDGTDYHLGSLKNMSSGMMSANNKAVYQIWVKYNR